MIVITTYFKVYSTLKNKEIKNIVTFNKFGIQKAMTSKLVNIFLPMPFDSPFSYLSTQTLTPLTFVKTEFRKTAKIGVAIESNTSPMEGIEYKPIIESYQNFKLPSKALEFYKWVANYNMCSTGLILKMGLAAVSAITKPHLYKIDTESEYNEKRNLVTLTKEQQDVADTIKSQNKFEVNVIDGITGSGKTEVYLEVIDKILKAGKQVLILLPEIVLTTQLIDRYKNRLGFTPLQWHSGLSPKNRKKNWLAALTGEGRIVVGARSALFLPYSNLGLIVVDEEHDQSFKQEEGVIYNARDMAIAKARFENIPIILSSATPSVETLYNIKLSKYHSFHLKSRFGDAVLPEVKLIDMNNQKMHKGDWISPVLRKELENTLHLGKQSLIFLNRRGYSPITWCGSCHQKITCPSCDFAMVEHKGKNIMQCHYCGKTTPILASCPYCGGYEKISSFGQGVEKIAEEVHKFLPTAKVAIMASDTTANRDEISTLLSDITNHKYDIIIGTQMITKGLHFPNLHLVAVLEAEAQIKGCDIRSLEKTYQLLHQVAGRAGREKDKGVVYLQTHDIENELLKNLAEHNHEKFITAELENREAANMPPFTKLALVNISSFDELKNLQAAKLFAQNIPVSDEIKVFGPSPAPVYKLRKKFRHRFVVMSPKNLNIQKFLHTWISGVKIPSSVKVKVDIDPYNFA